MVYFFSGTGNSRYCASFLSEKLGEKLSFIPSCESGSQIFDGNSLGFVFPVYSWGVPPIVTDFIAALTDSFFSSVRERDVPVWVVMTCGDEVALAPDMIKDSLRKRGVEPKGIWSVIMPNNYVILPGFNVDKPDVERDKLENAPVRLSLIADKISSGNFETDVVVGSWAYAKTRLIYPLFKKWGINPTHWRWTSSCVGCEICSHVCPVENIVIKKKHPVWGNNCISCLACYHHCPVNAIEYGNSTVHKGHYVCPLNEEKSFRKY